MTHGHELRGRVAGRKGVREGEEYRGERNGTIIIP